MVLVKNWPFSHLFFKDNKGRENNFYDILERKNADDDVMSLTHSLQSSEFKGLLFRNITGLTCIVDCW